MECRSARARRAAITAGRPFTRAAASSAAISASRAISAAPLVNSGTPGNAAVSPRASSYRHNAIASSTMTTAAKAVTPAS